MSRRRLYRRSSQFCHAAQHNLGRVYAQGRGTPKDNVKAYFWLELASRTIGEARNDRDVLGSTMTPEQIAEAQRLVREWKPKTSPPTPEQ